MQWFYSDNGAQAGPVSDDEIKTLLVSGKMTPETLVWREGQANWLPYRQVAGPNENLAPGLTSCSICGKSFPSDEVIQLEGRSVCAGCKPAALQLVKEGINLPGDLVYGGFWIRFGAKIIDGIILGIVNFALGSVVAFAIRAVGPGSGATLISILMVVVQLAIQAGYSIYFVGKNGATPGKMACGLKVIRPDGSPMTYGRATGRFFAELLNAFTFTIGYIIAGFDDEKRALHDRIADTRVIKTK